MTQIVTTVGEEEERIRISNNNRTNKHQLLRKGEKIMGHSSKSLLSRYMTMDWILAPIMVVVMTLIMGASTTPIMTIKKAMSSMMGSMPVEAGEDENL